jgi:8-oxo-(d)GTP phosphatase
VRDGAPDVAVVHRPRYDDWTLPKGKLRDDEPELLCAVREVREETGAEVAVQRRLGSVKYQADGRRKKVTYWAMRCTDTDAGPSAAGGGSVRADGVPEVHGAAEVDRAAEVHGAAEVDEVLWLRAGQAYRRLTYQTDRDVVADWTSMPVPDALLVLVRHAKAGKRGQFLGDDRLRPLDPVGEKQAAELATLLSVFAPTSIWSADRLRCEQTVAPLAHAQQLPIQVEPAFADEAYEPGRDGTALRLLSLAKPGQVVVVAGQGASIPALIDELGPGVRSSETKKGAFWVLPVVDGEVIVADHYDAPAG